MAKDKLFHKKRQRKANNFERAIEWRNSNELVLIVCEGEKTEPNYLRGLRHSLTGVRTLTEQIQLIG